MENFRPRSLEDRLAATKPGGSGLLAGDWRAAGDANQAVAPQARAFGRARQLHLRVAPGSHREELSRAKSVVDVAREVVEETYAAGRQGDPLKTADLIEVVDGITASLIRDPFALPSIVKLRQKHEHTYLHSVAVCGLMVALAHEMNLERQVVREVGLAGLLHDIGKATIPTEILDHRGALTPSETAMLRTHPIRGGELLGEIPGMPAIVIDVCKHHHERPDGQGYPFGFAAGDISLHARMAAICNFYDNLTCPKPGAEKWSPGQAIEYLRVATGQFDGKISSIFIRLIGTFLPGVLVRLSSDRLGVILDESCPDRLHPMVAIFQHIDGRNIPWQRLATRSDPILCIERPETWRFEDWPSLRVQLLRLSE
jgi:putative nucleotidyltransferase with HDIG domain